MKMIEEEISLTYQYDNTEEAQEHVRTMKKEGWREQKLTLTMYKFTKKRK